MKVIRMEATPNPTAMKFVLDEKILASGSKQFDSPPTDDALAKRLFQIPSVKSVFYMDDFITLDKSNAADWNEIKRQVESILAEGHAIGSADVPKASTSGGERLDKINEILDTKVRPALAGDGGGLEVLSLRDNDLLIRYQGACGSCPSSIAGTMYAIQNLLRVELNEEINVIAA